MHPLPAVGFLAATSTTSAGPPITELVPVHADASDPSWPPVLIACVAVVVLGGLLAAIVFLRQARDSARAGTPPRHRRLDG
jgi:hypothetical protein